MSDKEFNNYYEDEAPEYYGEDIGEQVPDEALSPEEIEKLAKAAEMAGGGVSPAAETGSCEDEIENLRNIEEKLKDINDKYVRLYAEFDNYKKRVNKDREELVKYSNESLIYDLLPSLDSMEIALKHENGDSKSVVEGVENTLRAIMKTFERFGLNHIEAEGLPFNPEFHHAMTQVETDELPENTVVEEFRTGYVLGNKVLRPSLVSVSKKPS